MTTLFEQQEGGKYKLQCDYKLSYVESTNKSNCEILVYKQSGTDDISKNIIKSGIKIY